MNDKFFLDSNVCIYAFDIDNTKKAKALDLIISNQATVSTQVLMETANVAAKKLKIKQEEILLSIDYITTFCSLHVIELSTIKLAFQISQKYQYSLYDTLIIASALESNCNILYSEDMQHGHLIDKRLIIVNPFL
jgi:predicted nucleic acid-binding protein